MGNVVLSVVRALGGDGGRGLTLARGQAAVVADGTEVLEDENGDGDHSEAHDEHHYPHGRAVGLWGQGGMGSWLGQAKDWRWGGPKTYEQGASQTGSCPSLSPSQSPHLRDIQTPGRQSLSRKPTQSFL